MKLVQKQFHLYSILILFTILLFSCKTDRQVEDKKYPKVYNFVRFDKQFSEADSSKVVALKNKYPYLFPNHDVEYWVNYKNDSLFKALTEVTQKEFQDFSKEENQINNVFLKVKENYPTFKPPKVLTLISNVDLNHQVVYADSLLIISLDTYLGKESDVYEAFPEYMRLCFTRDRIAHDVATALMKETLTSAPNPVFIERMVNAGKLKYAIQSVLPNYSEQQIINYTDDKYHWTKANEYNIWQYFLEHDYLYSSDKELIKRFLEPAPFSKFYIEKDAESPGQIGVWVGLQIVKSYAKKHKKTLPELLAVPAIDIFKQSHYKPNQ